MAVAEVLISKRVQLADKRHKKHMLHLMSPKMSLGIPTDADRQLLSLLPSRKHWVTLGEKGRYRKTEDGAHLQRRSASQCNKMAIQWTIEKDMSRAVKPAYLLKLQTFVTKLQNRVNDIEFRFDAPMVFPEKKDESSCRPLCKFTNLEDSVIIILANKYLTELFNNQFYDESLAFRSKRTYHGQKDYVTSHHDAIARIKEYRKQMIVEKFKNDEKNALGQSLTEKYQKEFGDKRFFKVYAVIFPTVEVGDDGMPKTGTDGNYVYVSEADKKTAKENAEKAREEIIGGADVEEVIEKYGVGNYSDQTTSYEGYSSDNGGKDTLEKLKNGEATEVSENKVGYIFYVMMNENDTDTRDYYIQYLASNNVDAQYEEMEAKWKNTIQIDEKGDMIGTAWDDIDMNKFGKAMIGLGVVGNEGDTTTQK